MTQKFKITIPLAILVTLITVIYQRSTGPTYPKKFMIGEGDAAVKVKFPRSHGGSTDAPIEIPKVSKNMQKFSSVFTFENSSKNNLKTRE